MASETRLICNPRRPRGGGRAGEVLAEEVLGGEEQAGRRALRNTTTGHGVSLDFRSNQGDCIVRNAGTNRVAVQLLERHAMETWARRLPMGALHIRRMGIRNIQEGPGPFGSAPLALPTSTRKRQYATPTISAAGANYPLPAEREFKDVVKL